MGSISILNPCLYLLYIYTQCRIYHCARGPILPKKTFLRWIFAYVVQFKILKFPKNVCLTVCVSPTGSTSFRAKNKGPHNQYMASFLLNPTLYTAMSLQYEFWSYFFYLTECNHVIIKVTHVLIILCCVVSFPLQIYGQM